jgi:hypothetical protein
MKTQGEIEAAICEGISRFEQEYTRSLLRLGRLHY